MVLENPQEPVDKQAGGLQVLERQAGGKQQAKVKMAAEAWTFQGQLALDDIAQLILEGVGHKLNVLEADGSVGCLPQKARLRGGGVTEDGLRLGKRRKALAVDRKQRLAAPGGVGVNVRSQNALAAALGTGEENRKLRTAQAGGVVQQGAIGRQMAKGRGLVLL